MNYFDKFGKVENVDITAHEELTDQEGNPIWIGVVIMSTSDAQRALSQKKHHINGDEVQLELYDEGS